MSDAPTETRKPEPADSLPIVAVRRGGASAKAPRLSRRLIGLARYLPIVPLIMALMLTGGFIAIYFQPPGIRILLSTLGLQPGGGTTNPIAVPAPPVQPAPPPAPPVVVGLGKVEPEGEVIVIAPPFGAGDARVAELRVGEGDRVVAGQILAVLDNERSLQAAVASARATIAAREAALNQTRAQTVAARREAQASLARAEATAENARRELERVVELRRRGFATDQSYDQRRTQVAEAERDVERTRATLTRYGAGDIDAQADVLLAARNRDLAAADLARAEADLDKAYAKASRAGTVLTIHAQPGTKPGTQGIMTLGDIDRMNVEVEIYQTHIGRVRLADPVEIRAEALGQALRGEVVRIGLEVVRQSLIDPSPAASTDARVVKVLVRLDAASALVARRFTGLQVTARIAVGAGS